jgi:hypothetical protein
MQQQSACGTNSGTAPQTVGDTRWHRRRFCWGIGWGEAAWVASQGNFMAPGLKRTNVSNEAARKA